MRRRLRTVAFYASHVAASVLALASVPALRELPLRVPITYERDGLFLTVLTKAIAEDGLRHATGFGAPFGTDLVDWPLAMWLPFAQLSALTRLLGEPGTALNLYWMATIVVAGLCATWALRRLRLGAGLAFVLGLLYAFQPYAFYRNVEHVNLSFPFVPLLALLCLRVAGTRPQDEDQRERVLTLLACLAQGFSYVYYSVFTCALLVAAAPIGCWRTGRPRLALRALLAIALLGGSTLVTVAPSLSYWRAHGHNPDLDYKPPRETDTYGLKLRHLLVPIAEHPLAPWRALADKVEAVDFPGDNENVLSKLGTIGGLGLLALLGLLLARAAGAAPPLPEPLPGAAALTLASLLLSNVGGLVSFFSVFVTPDIRCWGRIVVLLSFFCLLAAGSLLTTVARRLPAALRRTVPASSALVLLLVGGLLDVVPHHRLATLREGTVEAFDDERAFVREIERRLPAGAMVFQLPAMTVPVDRATFPPMQYYDPGRMWLHSRSLRWSWGAMIGRNHDWGRAVDALPLPNRLRTLALSGFSGLQVDRWGYTGSPRPRFEDLERELEALLGARPLVSASGRYSFFGIETYRRALEAQLGPGHVAHLRQRLLADMPIGPRVEGCGDETLVDGGLWRACGPTARFELRNWRPGAIRVTLRTWLRADSDSRTVIVSGPGFEDRVTVGERPQPYTRVFDIGGVDWPLKLKGPCAAVVRFESGPGDTTAMPGEGSGSPSARLARPGAAVGCSRDTSCLWVGDFAYETQRLIEGVPVNADGGVAARTKY